LGWKDQLEQFEAVLDVPVIFKGIRRCANNAKGRKDAQKFERWYEDNAFIYHQLVEKGGSYEQAKSQYLEEKFGKNDKDRDAYATKMRRDKEKLEECLSGKERCQELSAPGGEGL
jgi:hypothetical protein